MNKISYIVQHNRICSYGLYKLTLWITHVWIKWDSSPWFNSKTCLALYAFSHFKPGFYMFPNSFLFRNRRPQFEKACFGQLRLRTRKTVVSFLFLAWFIYRHFSFPKTIKSPVSRLISDFTTGEIEGLFLQSLSHWFQKKEVALKTPDVIK